MLRRIIRKYKRDERGLTLLELAVVLIIVGLITAPMLQAFRIYVETKHRDTTKINMNAINSALGSYYAMHGRYPCPSDRSIGFGETGHGEEQCGVISGLAPGTCETGGGACRAVNGAGNAVQVGGVPYVTLAIPMADTLDGWNRLFNYAVTELLTDIATFDSTAGAVEIEDEHGNAQPPVHGVVISAGENGAGAFNIYGSDSPCIATYAEAENCNNDALFLTSLVNEVQGPGYYDDFLLTSNWTQMGIWTYSAATPNDIHAVNAGRVGIGTAEPNAKLEVVGNIRTEAVHGVAFCDSNGNNCFPAALIGGELTDEPLRQNCPEGQVMYGIANGAVLCRPMSVTTTPGTCSSGPPRQYAVGINAAGELICEVP